jgi:nicotinic acid mononucleotide adenylyltransferase
VAERTANAVGVFPSSFNPITKGHVAILRETSKIRTFQEIMLVLDTQPMDKEILGATLVDRLLMLQVLFEDRPRFSIGPKGTDITFIVGYDTLARVFDSKYYEDREGALDRLFASVAFMVANRGDNGREAVRRLMASVENRRFEERVLFFEIPNHLAQISSNRVRQRVMEGKPFGRLVPAQVREFIEKVKLYYADKEIGPQGQKVNLYDLRTQILSRLYGLYPEGGVEIDIGGIVDTVVEGVRRGQMLETLLKSLPQYIPGDKKSDGFEDML